DLEPSLRGHITGGIRRWADPVGGPLQVLERAGGEVVQDTDGRPAVEQAIDEMGPEEAGAARDQDRAHDGSQRLTIKDRVPRKALIALRVSTTSGARSAIAA